MTTGATGAAFFLLALRDFEVAALHRLRPVPRSRPAAGRRLGAGALFRASARAGSPPAVPEFPHGTVGRVARPVVVAVQAVNVDRHANADQQQSALPRHPAHSSISFGGTLLISLIAFSATSRGCTLGFSSCPSAAALKHGRRRQAAVHRLETGRRPAAEAARHTLPSAEAVPSFRRSSCRHCCRSVHLRPSWDRPQSSEHRRRPAARKFPLPARPATADDICADGASASIERRLHAGRDETDRTDRSRRISLSELPQR